MKLTNSVDGTKRVSVKINIRLSLEEIAELLLPELGQKYATVMSNSETLEDFRIRMQGASLLFINSRSEKSLLASAKEALYRTGADRLGCLDQIDRIVRDSLLDALKGRFEIFLQN